MAEAQEETVDELMKEMLMFRDQIDEMKAN